MIRPIDELLQSFGLPLSKQDLYLLAFTHKSYTNEKETEASNERLEFLGDAVLEFLITDFLYLHYPDSDEGEMTALRSATVRKETLAMVAKELHFGDFLLLSKGEKKGKGNQKDYLLANTFEAFLGALYCDQGMEYCRSFLMTHLFPVIEQYKKDSNYIGPKTRFQELAQASFGITPHYTVVSDEGPDHNKIFTMAAMLGEECIAEGKGNSKQKAENEAAELAYQKLLSLQNHL